MTHLILYDGVCGLCNRLNRFILERDSADRFRFAPLQSSLAATALRRHGREANDMDTFYVLADYGGPEESLYSKGRAILFVLETLGGIWSSARVLEILPTIFLDALYGWVARRRYRWFGRSDTCLAPDPRHREKFLEDPVDAQASRSP